MTKLPLLEKNAYLKIFVSHTGIYAHLAYSHYELGRSYILKDFSVLPDGFEKFNDEQASAFWTDYILALEEKFGWQVVTDISGAKILKAFADEENGVNGLVILLGREFMNFQELLAGVRNYCPEIKVESYGNEDFTKMLRSFFRKFEYRDVIYVDLDISGTKVTRFTQGKDIGTLDAAYSNYETHDMTAKILTNDQLIEGIKDPKFRAFLREENASAQVINTFANYLYGEVQDTEIPVIKDILRSYVIIQLLSIFNANKDNFTGFGIQGYTQDHEELREYAVIVSGRLAKILPNKDLIIDLIDGLQLRGHFDLFYDYDKLLNTFGSSYFFGVNSQDIILSRHDMLSQVDRIIVPEIPGDKKERKVVMSGVMSNSEIGNVEIYALAPQLTVLDIPKQKTFFDFGFIRDAYVKDIGQKIKFDFDPEKQQFARVIFDCRYKPVVYGPDAKTNKLRIGEWFDE